jgi:hypothetical protein
MIGMSDDNERILNLIMERMAIGEERYGHGIRKNDDTRQWGTKTDSWTEMGLEEILDLSLYLGAQLIRQMDEEKRRAKHVLKMAKKIKRYEIIHGARIRDETMANPHECMCGGDSVGCSFNDPYCLTIQFHEAKVCEEDCYICDYPDAFPLL